MEQIHPRIEKVQEETSVRSTSIHKTTFSITRGRIMLEQL